MDAFAARIRSQVSHHFDDDRGGHDLSHLDRVYGLAEQLRSREGGDSGVLAVACYVHDFHRALERESGSYDGADARHAVDDMIVETLTAIEYPPDLVSHVCECVAFTDRYSFAGHALEPPSLEARILRDADNLDAIGAIGVARAFMFGGILGEPIWSDETAPNQLYEAGVSSSIVHHFHEKLLRIKDDMLTAAGKELAAERHEFMVVFLTQLRDEWESAGLSQTKAPQLVQR